MAHNKPIVIMIPTMKIHLSCADRRSIYRITFCERPSVFAVSKIRLCVCYIGRQVSLLTYISQTTSTHFYQPSVFRADR